MALFGSKKNTTKKVTPKSGGLADVVKTISEAPAPKTKSKAKSAPVVVAGLKQVLMRPRITEKAANMTTANVYTFDIARSANKHDVVTAVKALYKVTPIKVNVVNVRGKKVSLRTRRGYGTKNSVRKAYITLKAGDKIDFAS
jgi:large subunit ribosomal protein L23